MTDCKLHSLCVKCASIRFPPLSASTQKLHSHEQFDGPLYSQASSEQQPETQTLFDSFLDIEDSAKRGCHLCTLMFFSLALKEGGGGDLSRRSTGPLTVRVQAYETGSFLHVECEGVGFSSLRLSPLLSSTEPERYLAFDEMDKSLAMPKVHAQIAKWLNECENGHQHSIQYSEAPLPSCVIDVGPSDGSRSPRLVFTKGQFGKYATLTYRWGSPTSLATTTATLSAHISGIDMKALPKTLKDAILVTRILGLKYIWIDALVIIQDSSVDWLEQATHMPAIYENAWVNISADGATDSSSGFLGERNPLALKRCHHTKSGYVISPDIPDILDIMDTGILSRRGWVLQERIFSNRILHYGSLEVGWECQQILASERLPEGRPHSDSSWRGSRVRSILSHASVADHNSNLSLLQGRSNPKWQKIWKDEAYAAWYALIDEYTGRSLTYPNKDKLIAISGIATAFHAKYRSILGPSEWDMSELYISGLWVSDLARGLSYTARKKCKKPGPQNHATAEWDPEEPNTWTSRSPSFSWTSLDDSVTCFKKGLGHDELYEHDVEVVQVKTVTSTINPWDYENSCWVVLRGIVMSRAQMPEASLKTFMDPMVRQDGDILPRTCFLRLRVSRCHDGSHQSVWLIVHPLGAEGDGYRRLGIAQVWGDFSMNLQAPIDIKLV